MDAFIEQAIEANALFGGVVIEPTGVVCNLRKHRGSATEADRAHLQEWLDRRTEVLNVTIGPLTNAWKEYTIPFPGCPQADACNSPKP